MWLSIAAAKSRIDPSPRETVMCQVSPVAARSTRCGRPS
jgi:hypothetical protein